MRGGQEGRSSMAQDALLGIDLGTTAVKLGLFSAEDGRMLALSTQEYVLDTPRESWAELDPEIYWRSIVAGVAEVKGRAASWRIAAIGLSSQGQTFILLDKDHRPLRPAIVWLDVRAKEEVAFLLKELGPAAFRAYTGVPFPRPISSAPKIMWLAKHEPHHWARTRRVAMLPEFIGRRLTGNYVCDAADMGSSGLYGRPGWWGDALRVARIPREFLGEVKKSGELVGNLTPAAAKELGLEPGTPVGVGSNDQLTGAIGVANVRPGIMSGAIGAAMGFVGTLPGDADDAGALLPASDHAVSGLKMAMSFSITTGILLKWYRDRFAPGKSYDELVRMASSVEIGANGLTLLPHFAGMATPTFDSSVRGGLVGLTLAHGPAHVVRAILEAVGFTVRDADELLKKSFPIDWKVCRVIGGATRSAYWMQMVSDISGLSIEKPVCAEAAVFGGAICGGVAAGILPDLVSASEKFYRAEQVFRPGPDSEKYCEPYRRYREAMEKLYPGALGLA